MKKYFLLVLYLFFFIINSFANNLFFFKIKIPPAPTLQIGQAYEYVFKESILPGKKYRLLSQLDWPILPAFAFNISAEIKTKNGIHFTFSGQFSLPAETGKMKDIDCQDDYSPNMITLLSKHKAYLKKGTQYRATIGWMKQLTTKTSKKNNTIFIEPCLGLNYFSYNWLAIDGYTQYPDGNIYDILPYKPVTPATSQIEFTGDAAEYTQILLLPGIGLLFKFDLPKNWQLQSLLQVSPQVLAICIDNHFQRDIIFTDVFLKKGFSFHFDFSVEKKISPFLYFFFLANFSAAKSFNGGTLVKEFGVIKGTSQEGTSGTALYISNFSIGFNFKITSKF